MLKDAIAFSGFSVQDIAAAQAFYGETLGLDVTQNQMGLELKLSGGTTVFIYAKPDHVPAEFTILNFPVTDIDTVVDELADHGVEFVHYDNEQMHQDSKGIARGRQAQRGPDIAWFKDPAGNILSVLQN